MQQNTGISRHVFKLKLLLSENGKLMKQAFIMLEFLFYFFIWIDSLVVHRQTSADPAVSVLLDSMSVWREIYNVSSQYSAHYEFTALDRSTVPESAILPCESLHMRVCTSWKVFFLLVAHLVVHQVWTLPPETVLKARLTCAQPAPGILQFPWTIIHSDAIWYVLSFIIWSCVRY